MIKFINAEATLGVRNEVLREGRLALPDCVFPTDNLQGSFHLGYYSDEILVCIASFHPQSYGEFGEIGYQLRGMATIEQYRGQGIGNQLLNFAMVYLRGQKVNYVWCNARKTALKFYANTGFEIVSPEFEVIGIGPHYAMYVKLI